MTHRHPEDCTPGDLNFVRQVLREYHDCKGDCGPCETRARVIAANFQHRDCTPETCACYAAGMRYAFEDDAIVVPRLQAATARAEKAEARAARADKLMVEARARIKVLEAMLGPAASPPEKETTR